MAYASVADAQARIRTALLTIGAGSEPTTTQVTDWLEQWSLWVDQSLAWKYVVPVTQADDLKLLKPVVAALVAAECWGVIATANPGQEDRGPELRAEALAMLAYQPATARQFVPGVGMVAVTARAGLAEKSFLVLPHTALADSGEAAVGAPVGSFTDPDAEGSVPRFFRAAMEL